MPRSKKIAPDLVKRLSHFKPKQDLTVSISSSSQNPNPSDTSFKRLEKYLGRMGYEHRKPTSRAHTNYFFYLNANKDEIAELAGLAFVGEITFVAYPPIML